MALFSAGMDVFLEKSDGYGAGAAVNTDSGAKPCGFNGFRIIETGAAGFYIGTQPVIF